MPMFSPPVAFSIWNTGSSVFLACPLLAGPGAITTTLVLNVSYGLPLTLAAVVLCYAVTWIVLMFGEQVFSRIGKTGSDIITQVMALLLATIAVQFIRTGIMDAWHGVIPAW